MLALMKFWLKHELESSMYTLTTALNKLNIHQSHDEGRTEGCQTNAELQKHRGSGLLAVATCLFAPPLVDTKMHKCGLVGLLLVQ